MHIIDLVYVKQQEPPANLEEFTSQEELLGYLVSAKSFLAISSMKKFKRVAK